MPGKRAKSPIKSAIGSLMTAALDEAGDRHTARDFFDLGFDHVVALGHSGVDRSDDQVLHHAEVFFLEEGRVDRDTDELATAVDYDLHLVVAGARFDRFGLQL